MPFLAWVICGLLLFYLISLGLLYQGFRRLQEQVPSPSSSSSELPGVSIIVAARNEAHNLPVLLAHLRAQDYPDGKLEVIIVDDRSEDGSWAILTEAQLSFPALRVLRVTDTLPHFAPKKRALDLAIRSVQSEIILLTDADCTPPTTWARTVVGYYRGGIAGVIGYSPYRFDRPVHPVLQGMLALDYCSIFAVAAASSGVGRALTASGTNLSYRRQTYLDVGGFESIKEIVSGDDDLFLHEVSRKKAERFVFALDPQSHVRAAAPPSWRQFFFQRIRFASKGKYYDAALSLGLTGVFLLNVLILVGLVAGIAGSFHILGWTLGVFAAKALGEFLFIRRGAQAFGEELLLRFFLPTAIVHPLYITVFGFLGLFGRFEWKGVEYKKTMESSDTAVGE